jgi:hypothetical protein
LKFSRYSSIRVADRCMFQELISQLPTPVVRVEAHARSCGIYVGQSNTECVGVLRPLRFPLPIVLPPTARDSSSLSMIRGWLNTANWADVEPNGFGITASRETKLKLRTLRQSPTTGSKSVNVIPGCYAPPPPHTKQSTDPIISFLNSCQKVENSIPDDVNFFNLPNPSCRTTPCGLLSL